MATDLEQIIHEIRAFYDFTDKTVIAVGAGGGRLIEYARSARRVLAVDVDAAAVERLRMSIVERGLGETVQAVHADFAQFHEDADAVLFEFCLHQIERPERALDRAKRLAGDVVVVDHAPDSRWSWYAGEDALVARAWNAVCAWPVARQRDVVAEQHFGDFAELDARLHGQPPSSRERIRELREQAPIAIPMPWRLALL